jgi:hypothetical protein
VSAFILLNIKLKKNDFLLLKYTTATTVQTTTVNQPSTGQQIIDNNPQISSPIDNNYFYLFLLFIPLFFMLFIIFICCVGRCCQVRTNYCCNLICCPCFRSDDQSKFTDKYYDATIVHNREDKYLVEQFISEIALPRINYKIHKLSLSSTNKLNLTEKLSRENEKILRRSKRIILMFTPQFDEHDYAANRGLIVLLREIYLKDPNCVIIAVNKDMDRRMLKQKLAYIDSPVFNEQDLKIVKKRSCLSRLKSRIKYNCGLNGVEILDYYEKNFYMKFHYIMPIMGYDSTKPSVIVDTSLPYPRDFKNGDLKHIIVPIPEFMRTKLGFPKKTIRTVNETQYNVKTSNDEKTVYQFGQDTHAIHIKTIKSPKYANQEYQKQKSSTFANQNSLHVRQGSIHITEKLSQLQEPNLAVQKQQQKVRSETPEILAMFAPNPSTVVSIDGAGRSKSSSSRRKSNRSIDDYPTNQKIVIDDSPFTNATSSSIKQNPPYSYDI